MPFNISHTGRLGDVLPAAEKSNDAQHTALGKSKATDAGRSLVDKFLKALRSALDSSGFPPESDLALVMTGDAGENHLVINNLNLNAGKPKPGVEAATTATPTSRETPTANTQEVVKPAGAEPNSGAALNSNIAQTGAGTGAKF